MKWHSTDPRSARAVIWRALTSIGIALAIAGGPARADGSGQLGLTRQFHGWGATYVVYTDPSTDAGSFQSTGIPHGIVDTAYFYCHSVSASPSITAATFDGQPIALQWIGTMDATNPDERVHVWRAEIPGGLVTMPGTYTWSTQSGGTNRGACLLLLGYNLMDWNRKWELQVRDGAHGGLTADGAEALWPNDVVFGNFQPNMAWPTGASLAWVVAGGQPGLQERYLVEGASIAGDDPAAQGLDAETYRITGWVPPWTTGIHASISEVDDAVVWMVGVLRISVCDACPLPFCFADGTGPVACPCANGATGSGCPNSATGGASMTSTGQVNPDTLTLRTGGLVPGVLTVLLQGDVELSPVVFGDGQRCVGGRLLRMFTRNADAAGWMSAPWVGDPSLTQRSAALGDAIAPGSTRWYQLYYRDPAPGFCTGETFNASSGLLVRW